MNGLECLAAGAGLVVPEGWVEQVVELDCSPLPLTEAWVTGVAVHQGRLIVVIDVASGEVRPGARRLVKAVLLALPELSYTVALEVESVGKLLPVTRTSGPNGRHPWLGAGVTADGRELSWVEVERIRDVLNSGAP